MALHHDHIRISREHGLHVDFDAIRAGSIVRVGNVDSLHLGDHAAQYGIGGVGGDVILGSGEHGKHLGRVFRVLRDTAQHVHHLVQGGHGHGIPQLGLAVEIAEHLEPLEVIGEIVIAHGHNRDTRRLRRSRDGLVAAHGGAAYNQIGLEGDNVFGVPVFTRRGLSQHGHALILGHVAADIELIQFNRGAAADHAVRLAARLVPQGDEAAVQNGGLAGVLGNLKGRFGGRVGKDDAGIGHDNLVGLFKEFGANGRSAVGIGVFSHNGQRSAQQAQGHQQRKQLSH